MKQRQPARGRGRGAGLARAQDMDLRQAPAPALVEVAPEVETGNAAMAEEAAVEVAPTPQEIATPILDQVAANLESGGEGGEGGGDASDAMTAGAYLELIPESITRSEAPTEVGTKAKAALELGEAPGSQPLMDVSQDPPGFAEKMAGKVEEAVVPAIPAESGLDPAAASAAAASSEEPLLGLETNIVSQLEVLSAEAPAEEEAPAMSEAPAEALSEAPVEATPVEAAPVEAAPVEVAPVEEAAPATEAPAAETLSDSPAVEAPSESVSEAPAEAAPAAAPATEAPAVETEQGGDDEPEAAGEVAAGGYAQAVPEAPSDPDASAGGGGSGAGGAAAAGGGGDDGGAAASAALAGAASGSTGVSNDSGTVPTSPPVGQADLGAGQSAANAGPTGPEAGLDPAAGTGAAGAAAAEAVEASEVLSGESIPEVMSSFQSAKPSEMAASWSSVGGEVAAKGGEEESQFQESLPDYKAVMKGEGETAAATDVQAPTGDAAAVDDSPGTTPEAEVKETEDLGGYSSGFSASLSYASGEGASEEAAARQIGQSINRLPQGDADVDTNPGPPPPIPLQGESDPNRVGTKLTDGMGEADRARADARQKVLDSPGSELVQPIEVDETYSLEGLETPEFGESPDISELQEFQDLGLSADVVAGFDGDYGAELQGNLAAAQSEVDAATVQRDADRDAELAKAEADAATMVSEAQAEQEAVVQDERSKIEDKRAETVQAQEKAVKDLETEARSKQASATQSINQRVAQDQAKIDSEFSKAKSKSDAEVRKGEQKAASEKKKAEEKASKKSWWQKACDFVADALASIANVISGIFDAVRSAVNSIIEGVKSLANSIIDAACKFICDAIAAFGDFLKGAIQGLLGDIFPGLADALCSFVDAAVEYAQSKVKELAESLKEGIAALCDAVAGAINAVLSVYEGLIQGALALAQAVVTGDWGTFLLMALESALKLAGINPDEFYALVGKAEDTITFILENPGTFLGNCISAVAQGFGQFSDNFLKHLQAGFVDWLTGQAGDTGITMPDTLDLAGVMDIVMQVLGISKDKLREKAVEHLGEENVERFEFVWGFIESAISGGLAGLWEHTKEYLDGLWDMAIGAIQEWLTQKIIVAAVTKIATMFNPVGAIVQALLTAWDLYCWVKEEIARIMGVVNAVVNGLADIAMGNIGGAANAVEQALADLVPTAINLLANILGLGGIGAKVREIIEGIQETVDQAIDNMIEKVKGFFKGDDKGSSSESGEEASSEENAEAAEGEQQAEGEGEGEEDRAAPKLAGAYQTTKFQYVQQSDTEGIQFADISINGSYQLEVVDEATLKSNHAMGDGYDNQGISNVAKNAIQVALTHVIANSNLPIIDVLMVTNYSRFQSEALSIASGRVTSSGLKIKSFDIEYINGNGYESVVDAATMEAISNHAAGPPPSGWEKQVVATVASDKAVSDDPGHTYHVLEDRKTVVTTSEPKTADATATEAALGAVHFPKVWDPAVHDPFKHPAWETLKARAADLNPPMAEAQARSLWEAMMNSIGLSCKAQAQEKAGAEEEADATAKLARASFANIAENMLAGRFAPLTDKPYCLWSGGSITEQFAAAAGYTTLESTQAGSLFNQLDFLKDNWQALMPLWEELSRRFANTVLIGDIHCFQRWEGGVFKGVEKPTLEKRAKETKTEKDLKFKYHAIVAEGKVSNDDDNVAMGKEKVKLEDLKDLGTYDSQSAWKAAIDGHEAAVRGSSETTPTTPDPNAAPIPIPYAEAKDPEAQAGKAAVRAEKMKASWKKNYDKVIITKEDGEQVPTSELQPEVDNGETWTKDAAKGQKHLAEDWVEYQKNPGATKTAGATFADWAFSGSRNAAQALNADLGDDEAVMKRYSLQEKGVTPDKANKTKFEFGGAYGKVVIPTETLADGHKEYEIDPSSYSQTITQTDDKGDTIEVSYRTKAGGQYKATVENGLVSSMSAKGIRKKEPGDGRGRAPDKPGSSRTGVEATKVGEVAEEHDASHIIADEFQGSPQSASYNIITTSHEYNFNPAHTEQSMRWAEVQIGNKIEELTEKYKDTGGFRDMDMNVNIVWGDPDDDLLVGLLVEEAMEQAAAKGEIFAIVEEEKRIRDQIRANWAAYEKRHPGTKLQRVLMMDYNVDMHFFIGEEETTTEVFQTGIGPDKWLLGVK